MFSKLEKYFPNDMGTLSNVDTRRGEYNPPTLDLPSASSPGKQNTMAGVSSDYEKKEGHEWYVFRATYNRVDKAFEIITKGGRQVYLPIHYMQKEINGKEKRILEPLLPNILFVYCTPEQAEYYTKRHPQLSLFLKYYRNKTQARQPDGKHPPLIIRFEEMMNFIRATSIDNEHIKVVESVHCHYKSGDIVRVIEGEFKGVKGRVARVSGQQRVIVEIEGLCLVATAYIPSAFIEALEK